MRSPMPQTGFKIQVVRDVLGALHASLAVATLDDVPAVDYEAPSPLLGSPRDSSSTILTGFPGDDVEALQRQLFAGAAQATADYGRFLLSQHVAEGSSMLQLPQPVAPLRRQLPSTAQLEPAQSRPLWALNTSLMGMRAQAPDLPCDKAAEFQAIAGLERRAKPTTKPATKPATKLANPAPKAALQPTAKPSSYLGLHAMRKATREEPDLPSQTTPDPTEGDDKPRQEDLVLSNSSYLLPPAPRLQAATEAVSDFLIPNPRVLPPNVPNPRVVDPTYYGAPEEALVESPPARLPVPRLKLAGRAAAAAAAAVQSTVTVEGAENGRSGSSLPKQGPPTASEEAPPPDGRQAEDWLEVSCASQLSEASAALGRRAPAAPPPPEYPTSRVPDPKPAPTTRRRPQALLVDPLEGLGHTPRTFQGSHLESNPAKLGMQFRPDRSIRSLARPLASCQNLLREARTVRDVRPAASEPPAPRQESSGSVESRRRQKSASPHLPTAYEQNREWGRRPGFREVQVKARLAAMREFRSPSPATASSGGSLRPPRQWSICLRLKDAPQPHFLGPIPGQPGALLASFSPGASDGRIFAFDQVFEPQASQQQVAAAVMRLASAAAAGKNAALLAMGRAGSGKSHTLGGPPPTPAARAGDNPAAPTQGNEGVVQQLVRQLFDELAAATCHGAAAAAGEAPADAAVHVTAFSLVDERIVDLFSTPGRGSQGAGRAKGLEVTVDPVTKQTCVAGLAHLPLRSAGDLAQLLRLCGGAFAAGTGGAVDTTSVLTLHVTRGPAAAVDAAAAAADDPRSAVAARWGSQGQTSRVTAPYVGGGGGTLDFASPESPWSGPGGGGGGSAAESIGGGELTPSKLTFVEVAAGATETATTAGRMGLAALHSRLSTSPAGRASPSVAPRRAGTSGASMSWAVSEVVWAAARGRHVHVPYRLSKLTRYLQDTLKASGDVAVILCVDPAETQRPASLSTLNCGVRMMSRS